MYINKNIMSNRPRALVDIINITIRPGKIFPEPKIVFRTFPLSQRATQMAFFEVEIMVKLHFETPSHFSQDLALRSLVSGHKHSTIIFVADFNTFCLKMGFGP